MCKPAQNADKFRFEYGVERKEVGDNQGRDRRVDADETIIELELIEGSRRADKHATASPRPRGVIQLLGKRAPGALVNMRDRRKHLRKDERSVTSSSPGDPVRIPPAPATPESIAGAGSGGGGGKDVRPFFLRIPPRGAARPPKQRGPPTSGGVGRRQGAEYHYSTFFRAEGSISEPSNSIETLTVQLWNPRPEQHRHKTSRKSKKTIRP